MLKAVNKNLKWRNKEIKNNPSQKSGGLFCLYKSFN